MEHMKTHIYMTDHYCLCIFFSFFKFAYLKYSRIFQIYYPKNQSFLDVFVYFILSKQLFLLIKKSKLFIQKSHDYIKVLFVDLIIIVAVYKRNFFIKQVIDKNFIKLLLSFYVSIITSFFDRNYISFIKYIKKKL